MYTTGCNVIHGVAYVIFEHNVLIGWYDFLCRRVEFHVRCRMFRRCRTAYGTRSLRCGVCCRQLVLHGIVADELTLQVARHVVEHLIQTVVFRQFVGHYRCAVLRSSDIYLHRLHQSDDGVIVIGSVIA